MRIFITGSEGFIGSHLVEHLIKHNHKITALVLYNFSNSIESENQLSNSCLFLHFKLYLIINFYNPRLY